ncbi:bifunctional 5,10-methylene-tetrahydrofolate dehydrogenase/5,10-methylene-tetrahydrofolate cyclohydrolase [Babesia caballi]|uniref:Bifunctional 5,10-methylene-tetrahydrofolate dehydrogenase/5,10-methylene-tetrahydrofolate cyclohydrolase n=1 Tax=Babesia caballi TaxID=5871 RepID=A0AAV4LZH7_BABCB|nr:bifunctional 5,10-methylene-tetrahydrofolate dehydrogenase/5,10-methylene-tetrahydrofolate cyclohydrolase [Babesia caballi]
MGTGSEAVTREERDEPPAREPLEAIVGREELVHAVGAELDDVADLVGVAHLVRDSAEHGVAVGRVRPENVEDALVLLGLGDGRDGDGAHDPLDVGHVVDGLPDAAVHAQDLALDHGAERHALEDLVEAVPAAVGVLALLAQPAAALVLEAVDGVDAAVLVVAAQHVNLRGVLALEGE